MVFGVALGRGVCRGTSKSPRAAGRLTDGRALGLLPVHPTLTRQSSLPYVLGFSPSSHDIEFREMASL